MATEHERAGLVLVPRTLLVEMNDELRESDTALRGYGELLDEINARDKEILSFVKQQQEELARLRAVERAAEHARAALLVPDSDPLTFVDTRFMRCVLGNTDAEQRLDVLHRWLVPHALAAGVSSADAEGAG